jgi:hypothetical protein
MLSLGPGGYFMKSLIKKVKADKILKQFNYPAPQDFRKDVSAITYFYPDRHVVVTVDCLRSSLLDAYGLLTFEQQHIREDFNFEVRGTGYYEKYGGTFSDPKIVLPVFLLECKPVQTLQPKNRPFYGDLRAQCKYGTEIWKHSDVKDIPDTSVFGFIEAERARQFWLNIGHLALLRPLQEFVLRQPDPGMFIPDLAVPNFCYIETSQVQVEVFPFRAVRSLAVHAAVNKQELYNAI